MAKKNKPDSRGFVYSTNPDFKFEQGQESSETLPSAKQKLRIRLDTKSRAGKAVTLIDGFVGTHDDLEILGKKLKSHCGSGGSVKDGVIIVQGDQREKVIQWLIKNGFSGTKKSG